MSPDMSFSNANTRDQSLPPRRQEIRSLLLIAAPLAAAYLAELAMSHVYAEQNLSLPEPSTRDVPTCYAGKAKFTLSGDYYNRLVDFW